MNTLPNEVLLQIVDFLPPKDRCCLAGANSRLRYLVYRNLYKQPKLSTREQYTSFSTISDYAQTFVQHLDLSKLSIFMTSTKVNLMASDGFINQLQYMHNLTYINLKSCKQLSIPSITALISNNVYTVQHLEIEYLSFDDNLLHWIGVAMQFHLTTLKMAATTPYPCKTFGQTNDLSSMLTGPNKLEVLDLAYADWVSEQTIINISNNSPCLKELNLSWTHLPLDMVILHTRKLRNLQNLNLDYLQCYDKEFNKKWTDRDPQFLSGLCGDKEKLITYTKGAHLMQVLCPSMANLSI